jgi:hypothetical protein
MRKAYHTRSYIALMSPEHKSVVASPPELAPDGTLPDVAPGKINQSLRPDRTSHSLVKELLYWPQFLATLVCSTTFAQPRCERDLRRSLEVCRFLE